MKIKRLLQTIPLIALLTAVAQRAEAVDITFGVDDQTIAPGGTVTVPIVVQNYSAAGFQFTFNWDPAVLGFERLQGQQLPNLNSVQFVDGAVVVVLNESFFNLTQTDQGRFTAVYDSGNGQNETVADGTGIFEIVFNVLGADGSSSALTFTDDPTARVVASQTGPETFLTDNGTITISNPPSISHQIGAQTTAEDTNLGGLGLTVSDQETDDGQLTLSFTETANPGLIDTINFVNNAGAVTAEIVPAANANGSTDVTISVTDGGGGTTASAPFTLTITPVNDDPIAGPDSGAGFSTDEDTSFTTGDVLLNDLDVDGDTVSVTSVSATDNGTSTVTSNSDGTFTYDPNGQFENLAPNQTGTDSFTYTISDGNGGTATGTVSIVINGVNDNAVGVDDSGALFTTDEDTPFITGNVVTNDTDVDDGAQLDVVAGSLDLTGTQGLVQSNMDGTFSYDPDGKFENLKPTETATDTFTYEVSDGVGPASTATVSITISGINDPPVAADDPTQPDDATFVTDEDTSFSTGSVLANDTDVDQDPLTVTLLDTTGTTGTATIGANGGIDYDPNGQFEALAEGESDIDIFTYTVDDGAQGTDTALVTITINGVNDAPVAVDDSGAGFSTDEDSAFTTGSVLPNDTDPDTTDTLSVEPGSLDTTGTQGTVTDNGDGTFEYDPNGAFENLDDGGSGTDTFTYNVTDGNGGKATATVTIEVTGVNDGPTAVDDPFTIVKNTTNNPLAVLANDTDPDGETLTVTAVDSPGNQGGTVTINGTNDGLLYTPAAEVVDVDEVFTYTISDGDLTSTATVTVTLISNPSPIAVDDSFTGITEDDPATPFAVLVNDSDPDDEPIQVTAVQSPSNEGGTVVITGGGTGLSYTPALNFNGGDSFTYTISDGISTATATVNVTVDPVDDTPTITDVTDQTIDENIALKPSNTSVTFTVEDVETDPLALTVTATSNNQTLLPDASLTPARDANPNGQSIGFTLDLTPVQDQAGTATVTLTVSDGSLSANDTFDLIVNDLDPVTGASHDGLLSGATVFFDEDMSGTQNGVEPSVQTDNVGNFNLIVPIGPFDDNTNGSLDANEGRLVATGGRDIATGLDNQVSLSAPVGSTVVNALTTVIQRSFERGAASPAAAETQLKAALSIPNGVDLTSANLFAAASGGDADAAAALLVGAQVWDTVLMISSLVAGDLGQTVAQTFGATFDELVTDVTNGTAIDFTSTTYLASLLADVQTALGSTLTAEEQSGAVLVLSNVNQLKQNQAGQAPATIAANVSQVQTIAQSSVSQDLQNVGSGAGDLEDAVLFNTGTNLSTQVTNAPIGDIDGTSNSGGTVEFESATASYFEDGTPIDPIVIRRTGGNTGDANFTLTPSVGVGTATQNVDYNAIAINGTLTNREIRGIADTNQILTDDVDPEGQETFQYTLTANGQGVQLGAQTTITVAIVDNDSSGTFQFNSATYAEVEANAAQTRNVTIVRSEGAQGAVDLVVTPSIEAGNTATAADLTSINPITVSFAAGALTRTIALPIVEDIFVEGDDTFTLTLTAAAGAPPTTTIGAQATAVYTITNDDFNTAPTLAQIGPRSINEDGALSIQIGTTDLENDPLTVTLSSSNQALLPDANLSVAPNGDASATRTLTATPVANGFGATDITVTLSDGQLQDTATFTLTVNPVNDAPVLNPIPDRSFVQAGLLTVTAPFSFTDVDFDPATTRFSFTSSNTGLLPVNRISVAGNGTERDLNLSPIQGVEGSTTIALTVSDGQFRSTQTFDVFIGAPNLAPTISPIADQQINEDTSDAVGFVIGDDKTDPGALTVSAVSSNDALISGTGGLVLGGAGSQRTLSFTPAANQTGTATITVSVGDGEFTTTEAFSVLVNAVNDGPTIAANVTELTIAGDGSSTVNLTVGDIDNDLSTLQLSALAADGTLFPPSAFAFAGSGADRSVTITPAEDRDGSSMVVLSVSDGDQSAQVEVLVLVEASFVPPTISGLANIDIEEDSSGSSAFTISDANTPVDSLVVTAVSLNGDLLPDSGIVITGTGADRVLQVTPVANGSGIAQVRVTVSDGEFDATQTIAVTVTEVPDAPTISAIESVTIEQGTSAVRAFTLSDADTDLGALALTVVSSNDTLIGNAGITLSGSGAERLLRAAAFLNQLGTTTLTVTVSDGENSASSSFDITVTEPNIAPSVVASVSDLEGKTGEVLEFEVTLADGDDPVDGLTVSATSSRAAVVRADRLSISGSGATRLVQVTPNGVGQTTIRVTVSDGKDTASVSVSLLVRPSVSILMIGNNVQVSWSGGFLELADSPLGPWTRFTPELPGPANISFPVAEAQRYFRAVLE